MAGDVVQVASNMQFGIWIQGQKVSEPVAQVDTEPTNVDNSAAQHSSTTSAYTESTESPASPSTTPFPESTTTVSSTSSTTVIPLPRCANFTPVTVSDATQGLNETLSEIKRFEDCCDELPHLASKCNILNS